MGTKERVEIINTNDSVINKLLKRISNLEFEVEERDRRIDKAIEYIENHSITNIEWWIAGEQKIECKFMKDTNPQDLLDILKGSDKE